MREIITIESDLISWLRTRACGLVVLDGYHGIGKSTLASEVAKALEIQTISVDDYVTPQQGSYVAAIDFTTLREEIGVHPTLLEGVCMLRVLRVLELSPDVFVYVAPPSKVSVSEIAGPLASEVELYHQEFSPESGSDVVFRRENTKENYEMESLNASVDVAYIKAKAAISITLAIGGMITLIFGFLLLFHGISGEDKTIIKLPGVEMSAGGLGGVIMATSVAWAYFAYMSRPSYARSRQMSEEYGPEAQLLKRTESASSTQAIVDPRVELINRPAPRKLRTK